MPAADYWVIYLYVTRGYQETYVPGVDIHVEGVALREDGVVLACERALRIESLREALGRGICPSKKHLETYQLHCPEGFELVWVHDGELDDRVRHALSLQELKKPSLLEPRNSSFSSEREGE